MSKQAIKEKLDTCKNLLAEKKLKESTFEDIVRPSLDLLDHVHDAMERGDLDLPPLVDDNLDISKMLDTSEKDLSTIDGTLTESVEKEQTALQEKERSYTQIVQDYIAQGGTGNFEEWRAWIETQPDAAKARVLNKNNFRKNYELLAGPTQVAPTTNAAGETVTTVQPDYTPSENLKNLMDMCHANEDFVETLYTVFFNRVPSDAEVDNWEDALDNGATRAAVIDGFAASAEWANTCSGFGITK